MDHMQTDVFTAAMNKLSVEEAELARHAYGSPSATESQLLRPAYPTFEVFSSLSAPCQIKQEPSRCSTDVTSPMSCRSVELAPESLTSPEPDMKPLVDQNLSAAEKALNKNGKFICSGCNRRYARRDRMETCYNNHRHYRAHRCVGQCGNRSW
jgi:hypothetical protein